MLILTINAEDKETMQSAWGPCRHDPPGRAQSTQTALGEHF
jgi:hypothetical protein